MSDMMTDDPRQACAGAGMARAPDRVELRIPRDLASRQLIAAVMRAGPHAIENGWRLGENAATFQSKADQASLRVVVGGADPAECAREIQEIDALTLDVLLVVFDLLFGGRDGVVVTPRTILEAKGYRRWGRERQAFERKILRHLLRVMRFQLEDARGLRAFFEFAPRNVARTDFVVRPGPALAGGVALNACLELPRAILHIDHRRNRGADPIAKKLAVLFALSGPMPSASVGDLLTAVGEAFGAEEEARHGRLAVRFEAALGRLAELGLFDVRQPVTFTRRKGWIQPWLYSRLAIAACFPPDNDPEPEAFTRSFEPAPAADTSLVANWELIAPGLRPLK